MNRIVQLSQATIGKIAAGEIIGSPSSVLKELLENSIDAGARNISIVVNDMGKKKIVVEDDGGGIHEHDLKLTTGLHTTSKLSDIDRITTLGFRGEALFAIDQVSSLEIISHNHKIKNGLLEKCSFFHGTKVIVRNLYASTPLRYKFLRSKTQENNLMREMVSRYCLSYKEINFSLEMDSRSYQMDAESLKNFYFPENRCNEERFSYQKDSFKMEGAVYIGMTDRYFMFLNQRPVRDRNILSHFRKLYEKSSGVSNVSFIMHIFCPPEIVDINVYPSKEELRFVNDEIFLHLKEIFKRIGSHRHEAQGEQTFLDIEPEVTQVFERYLVFLYSEEVVIMDQHAAHERIVSEKVKSQGFSIQSLVEPKLIFCNAEGRNILYTSEEWQELFDYEILDSCIILRGIPDFLKEEDVLSIFSNITHDLGGKINRYLHDYGCHNSIRSGEKILPQEAHALLREIKKTPNGNFCNHGRRTYYVLSKSKIDRFFGR